MAISRINHIIRRLIHVVYAVFFSSLMPAIVSAQQPAGIYTIKKGRMYIELKKQSSEASLDSFVEQYELTDLELKRFIKYNFVDSLVIHGWKLEKNEPLYFVISKPLAGLEHINDPAEKIIVTEKNILELAERFPVVSKSILYGFNRFKNKYPFAVNDSIVTFYLRNNRNAQRVMLAGSFNYWKPDALAMQRTDSGWIAKVKLGPGKYWYKFIVDGNWTIDKDNLTYENDGRGNDNSVYFKTNFIFKADFPEAQRVYVAGSFNQWRPRELPMNQTAKGRELPLYLADGTHTYRFVADNKWYADPANPEKLPNEFNDYNSVIRIGNPYLFSLLGFPEAKQVVLSGSFNNWRRDELYMKKTNTGWELPYVLGPGNYQYRFIVDDKWVSDNKAISSNGNSYFVIGANYTFRLKGFENAQSVFLAGDFNDWSPNTFKMERSGDEWLLKVHLTPGKHLYKFIVDGKWILDPANKLWEQNKENTGNSVIWIEKNPVM